MKIVLAFIAGIVELVLGLLPLWFCFWLWNLIGPVTVLEKIVTVFLFAACLGWLQVVFLIGAFGVFMATLEALYD